MPTARPIALFASSGTCVSLGTAIEQGLERYVTELADPGRGHTR